MPAMLDDPTSPLVYRTSGQGPYPSPDNPQIPSSIFPKPVTLRDRVTVATLIPFFSPNDVPKRLLSFLCDNLNKEIEGGDTYPMVNSLPAETFGPYWFGNFAAVMILGDIGGVEAVNEMDQDGTDWNKQCLGSFYVKPNYPGRSSHVCNGGFIVTQAARNKGVGKFMGQCYLEWAPQLGYTYSVFNLVYESNTASTKIWDSLGFKRIGRVPGCGNLKSFEEPVDAIIYGRDLKAEGENVLNEERFDKIRYYLRHLSYPQGADRSEKSRLRSAATHYKLIPADDGVAEKLMLKDKEVISDPNQQYDIARETHLQSHGGINKTTALIATKYHWVRIKETVSHVIKVCPECKESAKAGGTSRSDSVRKARPISNGHTETTQTQSQPPLPQQPATQTQPQPQAQQPSQSQPVSPRNGPYTQPPQPHEPRLQTPPHHDLQNRQFDHNDYLPQNHHMPLTVDSTMDPHDDHDDPSLYSEMDIDPQILEQIQAQIANGEFSNHEADFQSGLPQYVDTSQLQHDPNGFDVGPNGNQSQFMHDPSAAMMGHSHDMSPGQPHMNMPSHFQPQNASFQRPGTSSMHSSDQQHMNVNQNMQSLDEQMMDDGSGLNNMQQLQQHVMHLGDFVNGDGRGMGQ